MNFIHNRIKFFSLFTLVTILSLLVNVRVQAAHIVGGDMFYRCIDGVDDDAKSEFEVTMTLYRDSKNGGSQFDGLARFGLFERDVDGIWQYQRTIGGVPVQGIEAILEVGSNPCLIIPPDVGVQKGVYKFDVTLFNTDTEYMIAYQRCCRNGSITNIKDPGTTGSVTSVIISSASVSSCNNSPSFTEFPPIVICKGQDVNFDHSAIDVDGDIVLYEFCAPLASGGVQGSMGNPGEADNCDGVTPDPLICGPDYPTVQFQTPTYSVFNPLGGSPQVSIDANTGLISGVPLLTGQFVVGICAKEYRNGVLIGEIRRDFQFNVTDCDQGIFARIQSDEVIGDNEYVINSCGDFTVDIINESGLIGFIEEYRWEFDIDGTIQTFTTRDVSLTLPDIGTYTGSLFLNSNVPATGCRDTAEITINLYPPILADYTFDYDTCIAGPVVFDNMSASGSGFITEHLWTFADGNTSLEIDPEHNYQIPGLFPVELRVTDINNCQDSITQPISYFPVPGLLIIEPSVFIGCKPANIFFENLSVPIDSTYDILWDFGDGGTSNEISPLYEYEEVGVYDVSLDIVSPIGCETSANFNNWIEVLPSPTAGFICDPEKLSNFNNTLTITDDSEDAEDWFYVFGDGGVAYIAEPVYTYRDTGIYEIMQVVRHESGCTDTLFKTIDVSPVLALHMPNAFTPNNDGLNDVFKGKGFLPGIKDYSLMVWNRWGERIFESNDPLAGWNGQYNNTGNQASTGVYVFTVSYKGPRGDDFEIKGHVTLIR